MGIALTNPTTNAEYSNDSYGLHRSWQAKLDLRYAVKHDKTRAIDMRFVGPLRVQRPFYPEGGRCHTYLLHPPGGMVSGDRIDISVDVDQGAQALITTPSAGKIYGADSANVVQTQTIQIKVGDHAELEFLPQENILFDGANARLKTVVDISSTSRAILWDIVSFGRPHGGYYFKSGTLQQTIEMYIDGQPCLLEGFETDPELRVLESQIGLMGHLHMASMFIAVPDCVESYDQYVDQIRSLLPEANDQLKLAATHRNKLIIVRGLADDIEVLRNAFISIWQHLRPTILNTKSIMPRIWLT